MQLAVTERNDHAQHVQKTHDRYPFRRSDQDKHYRNAKGIQSQRLPWQRLVNREHKRGLSAIFETGVRTMTQYYKIVRFYRDKQRKRTLHHGLTLEQAQEHCRDPETSSRTATSAKATTRARGPWFDGYEKE
jgi:hypothetical protein